MQKKILSIILAIVMIVGTFSVGAIAIEADKNGETNYFYVENITDTAGNVTWNKSERYKNETDPPKLQYSTNGNSWSNVEIGTAIELKANGKIYFRDGNTDDPDNTHDFNGKNEKSSNYIYISCDVNHNVGGDITTLINANGSVETLPSKYIFSSLFRKDEGLINANELILPSIIMSEYCYQYMFDSCINLITAPNLPATTLAEECYSSMFYDCESLKEAPALPATELAPSCYSNMFTWCENLETAPALPAESLATYCYSGMFSGCTKLTTAPALPATKLAERCYSGMFNSCTSLETAPALPATDLTPYCYASMFMFCTNLTEAPALPAAKPVQYCYDQMFFGCTKLNSITVGFSYFEGTFNWLADVAEEGTLHYAPSFTTSYTPGPDTIPEGWEVETALYPIHTHAFGEVTYIWNEDLTTCTAYHTCTDDTCGHTELETVTVVKGQDELTATFSKPDFTDQTKNIEDVTEQFYVSCYTNDGKCLTVGVPEKKDTVLNLKVSQNVFENMATAKLFTVNKNFKPLRPERAINK